MRNKLTRAKVFLCVCGGGSGVESSEQMRVFSLGQLGTTYC